MKELKLYLMNLHLFAEGGASTGNASASGEASSGAKTAAAAGQKGEYANVVFGKQESATAEDTQASASAGTTDGSADKSANKERSFEDLINGEYKEDFTKKTQDIINKRFKETKNMETKLQSYEPLMQMLEEKYGKTDIGEIIQALESDSAIWQDAADEAGMSVEQYKEVQKLKRENAAMRAEQQKASQQQYIEQKMAQWNAEAEQLKGTYPSFNLETESQNQQFLNMLKAGVPMEHAYKVIHYDEIMSGAVNTIAGDMQKAVTDHIRARGARPAENGSFQTSPFTVKDDVSKLSKADRAEIVKRVARGERISF